MVVITSTTVGYERVFRNYDVVDLHSNENNHGLLNSRYGDYAPKSSFGKYSVMILKVEIIEVNKLTPMMVIITHDDPTILVLLH
jgi:hypothetical protein